MPIRLKIVNSILIMLTAVSSCKNDKNAVVIDQSKLTQPLIEMNKSKVELENEQIEKYVKRRQWDVIKTGTGLRYMIYQKGSGKLAENGQKALVTYTVTLLNGDTAYTTKESGPQEFLIGMDNVESGLHEGITYMHVGDKARLILPSFLAHGLAGDRNKIPMRSTIVYDIELIELK